MKLWGGRFSLSPDGRDPQFEQFSESFSLDQRFILYDLRVNRAYVQGLGRAGVLRPGEVRRLTRGLDALRRRVERDPHGWRGQASPVARPRLSRQGSPAWGGRYGASEDVHTWVEARMGRIAGDAARALRTGRSRNDLVATEARLYVKDAVQSLEGALAEMLTALLGQARRSRVRGIILPGYTHLQPAQPVLFAHYLLAYFEMFSRDLARLEDCRERADELPMGTGALAGTAFPIDRERLARELGFARIARNSLDVTSDRDFVAELLFACALIMLHLSRWAEDLIIYSSPGFGYVELADAYSTGSSLMPQKKNPDSLELIRGKAATVVGKLTGMLALLKGLPLAYNRDLQEDKAALFGAVDTTQQALRIAARVARTLKIHPERMQAMTRQGFLTATDLADELVRRGVPFAKAHERVGKLVRYCSNRGQTFGDLTLPEARRLIPAWDVKMQVIANSPRLSVERRKGIGGTAPSQVARQIASAERALAQLQHRLARR